MLSISKVDMTSEMTRKIQEKRWKINVCAVGQLLKIQEEKIGPVTLTGDNDQMLKKHPVCAELHNG